MHEDVYTGIFATAIFLSLGGHVRMITVFASTGVEGKLGKIYIFFVMFSLFTFCIS